MEKNYAYTYQEAISATQISFLHSLPSTAVGFSGHITKQDEMAAQGPFLCDCLGIYESL